VEGSCRLPAATSTPRGKRMSQSAKADGDDGAKILLSYLLTPKQHCNCMQQQRQQQ